MLAPEVESLMLTVCAEAKVPAAGVKVGVATVAAMVYAADTTGLGVKPPPVAMAWIVSAVLTVIGPA